MPSRAVSACQVRRVAGGGVVLCRVVSPVVRTLGLARVHSGSLAVASGGQVRRRRRGLLLPVSGRVAASWWDQLVGGPYVMPNAVQVAGDITPASDRWSCESSWSSACEYGAAPTNRRDADLTPLRPSHGCAEPSGSRQGSVPGHRYTGGCVRDRQLVPAADPAGQGTQSAVQARHHSEEGRCTRQRISPMPSHEA